MTLRFVGIEQNGMNLGLDTSTNPKELVCGKSKSRWIAVDPAGNFEQAFTVVSSKPSVVKVVDDYVNSPPDMFWYELQGKKAGRATIELRDGSNNLVDSILVRVYRPKTKKVNFFRVSEEDTDGAISAQPVFQLAQVPQILAAANALFKLQVNVTWETHLVREIKMPSSLQIGQLMTTPERYEEIVKEFKKKVKKLDPSPDRVSVVCVKQWGLLDLGSAAQPDLSVVYGVTYDKMCIVEDLPELKQFGLLVAHELGHSMGATVHSVKAGSLMLEKPDTKCANIYPTEAVLMRGGEPK